MNGANEHIVPGIAGRGEVEPLPVTGRGSLEVSAGAGVHPQHASPVPVETELSRTAQPLDHLDVLPVRCPACRDTRPVGPCAMCRGKTEIVVFWGSNTGPGVQRRGHLIIVDAAPAQTLCGDEFAVGHLGRPGGLPCRPCMDRLDQLATGRYLRFI